MTETYPDEFMKFWSAYPKRDRPDVKKPAFKNWLARLKSGISPELLIGCALEYAKDQARKGKLGTEYVMRAETFLGPNERYVPYTPQIAPGRPVASPRAIPAEPRPDPAEGLAFIRSIMNGLVKGKTSPTCTFVRAKTD